MTITITWWSIVIFLVLFPIVYSMFRTSSHPYDMGTDVLIVLLVCWMPAITICAMKFIDWIKG